MQTFRTLSKNGYFLKGVFTFSTKKYRTAPSWATQNSTFRIRLDRSLSSPRYFFNQTVTKMYVRCTENHVAFVRRSYPHLSCLTRRISSCSSQSWKGLIKWHATAGYLERADGQGEWGQGCGPRNLTNIQSMVAWAESQNAYGAPAGCGPISSVPELT